MPYGRAVMIGRLRGTVAVESPDGLVVIDVHGVGYEVMVPLGSLGRAARDAQHAVTLYVVTHVREDAITLFGFASEDERATFRLLTSVAGIGPRIAVSILGALPPQELAGAVARNDVRRLQTVPGVGRRLAERLALELKDKLGPGAPLSAAAPAPTSAGAAPNPIAISLGPLGTVVDMLVRLGFKQVEAERAAAELKGREAEPVEDLVREALRQLAR